MNREPATEANRSEATGDTVPGMRLGTRAAVFGLAYFLAHEIAFLFPDANTVVMAVWPAGGIGLAALLLSPRRQWGALLAVLFVAGNLANLTAGRPILASAGFMTANVLESLGCAWVISRWRDGPVRFDRVLDVVALMVGATLVNAGPACLGAATATIVSAGPFWRSYQAWWVSDGLGILLVTPLIVAWCRTSRGSWFPGRWRAAEAAALAVVASGLTAFAFGPAGTLPNASIQPYTLVIVLCWAGLRLGVRGTALLLALIAGIALGYTATGHSGFPLGGQDPTHRLLLVQLFLGVCGCFALLLAASRSERTGTEEALQHSQALLQSVHEGTSDAVYVKDLQGRYLMFNSAAAGFVGKPIEEVLGKDDTALFAPDEARLVMEGDRQVMASGVTKTYEEFVTARGVAHTFLSTKGPVRNAQGQVVGLFGIARDITERELVEAELERTAREWQTTFDATNDAIWILDKDHRVLRSNKTAERFFQQPCCEMLGQPCWAIVHGTAEPHPQCPFVRARQSGHRETMELQQGERWFEVLVDPILDAAGEQAGAVHIVSDITERKQAEADLRFVSRRLELIARMTNAVVGNRTTAEVAQRLAARVQECFEVDACVIRILQADQLVLIGGQGVPAEQLPARLPVYGLAQQILTTCQPLVIPDVRTHPLTQDLAQPAPGALSFVSYAGIPLIAEGNTVGILAIYTTRESRLFTAVDVEHLQIVAHHVAANLFNEHLFNTVKAQKSQLENVVTEREKAEAELRERTERLHLAQRAARFGVWDHDFKTQRSVWTAEQEALFGFAPGTYDGTAVPFDQLIHPDDRPRLAQAMAHAMETGAYALEFRATRRDGQLRWFAGQGQTYRDAAGRLVRMIGINIDITERKQAEERVLEQAALLDAANDAIYVRTLDHTVTYWNAGAERLYGWPRAEALGRKITEMGDAESVGFAAAHAALLEQGHWSGELTKISKAGKELVVFCRWTLLRDEQGWPREVLAINTDVTEKKQMEVQFLRAQRMEGIGALAGGIAHDLNNILAPILMVGPLLRETVSDPESRQMLYTVENCAQRGADIIKQLLTFARGQPGVRAPLPVRHLLNEMHKLIRETFPRNIQSHVNVPKDLWLILGDATQIHQALMNLCVNARDALPEGGTLTLAAENVTLDETAAALAPEAKPGAYVRVSVTDTGTGIPSEIVDRIFDPFFTTKEIGKGTGLGLATVLGIVRGHGGFVRVSSRVGQGTTFELHLPASPEVKADGTPETKALPPRGQGELILVVDDEAAVREITQRTLEKYGYRVLTAREGAEALALFGEHREVRAVITDMMMPGMDGPKLVQALRQVDARLPIVGMTGLAERAGVKGLEALNLPVVLNKPFAATNLLAVVSQVLASSRPTPQVEQLEPQ